MLRRLAGEPASMSREPQQKWAKPHENYHILFVAGDSPDSSLGSSDSQDPPRTTHRTTDGARDWGEPRRTVNLSGANPRQHRLH